jgi:putative DNA primase/helicase
MPAPLTKFGVLEPPVMTLSPDAKKAWVEYHDAVEFELSANGEFYDIQDVAAKSADNAVRLAALFSMFEGEASVINAQAFERASVISAWHLQESQRFFGEFALSTELSDAVNLECWLIKHSKKVNTITFRLAQQKSFIRDKNRLESALQELEDLDRLRIEQVGKSKIICINPRLL